MYDVKTENPPTCASGSLVKVDGLMSRIPKPHNDCGRV